MAGNAVLNVSGDAEVTSNGSANVYLPTGAKINVVNTLTSSAPSIGVTLASGYNGAGGVTDADFTNGYSTYNSGVNPNSYFFSDNAAYSVSWNSSNTEAIFIPNIQAPTISVTFGSGDDYYAVNETVPIQFTIVNPNSFALTNTQISQIISATTLSGLDSNATFACTMSDSTTLNLTFNSNISTLSSSIPANGSVTCTGSWTVPADPPEDETVTDTIKVINATASGHNFVEGYSDGEGSDTTLVLYTASERTLTGVTISSDKSYFIITGVSIAVLAAIFSLCGIRLRIRR